MIVAMMTPKEVIVTREETVIPPVVWWPWTVTSYNWWPYWGGWWSGGNHGGYGMRDHREQRKGPHEGGQVHPWGGASQSAHESGR